MPLLYRSEYIKTEIAPQPIALAGSSAAELGQHFDRAIHALYQNMRANFETRSAAVLYDPTQQQIEVSYRLDDTEPGCYYQFHATVAALVNRDHFGDMQMGAVTEIYLVITASVKKIVQGYWTVFDNADRLHEKLAEEIRGLLPTNPENQAGSAGEVHT
ncbi:MAG: hypothetical protein NXI24_15540 [bacterium]|nr:hypothetical protein [bacterium]